MIKKSLIALASLFIALPSVAEVNSGFYRIQNYKTERYAYMLDDRAYIDKGATRVDLTAIELWKSLDKTLSDPATIIYIDKNGNNYDLTAQGTSVYAMIGEYLHLLSNSSTGAYKAYGRYSGLTKYLADGNDNGSNAENSFLNDSGNGDYLLWNFIELDNNSDNFFGIQSTCSGNNGDFTTIYMGFDLTLSNAESKAYVITKVDSQRGCAVYEPIEGIIPAKVPVIIKTAGTDVANNKAVPSLASSTEAPTNCLVGVFFDNTRTKHENNLKYDGNTMRVLGVLSDGNVGFVKEESREYAQRNKAYLKVEANCPNEVKLVTPAEYETILAGIDNVVNDNKELRIDGRKIEILKSGANTQVFNTAGKRLYSGHSQSIILPSSGIYLIKIDSKTYKIQIK